MVNSAHVLNQAIGTLAHPITRAVQAPTRQGEGVSNKAFGGHARALVVALRQTCTTDVQLTRGALRHQCQISVENVGHARANHVPDRHTGRARVQRLRHLTGQWHDHRLGRPIGVKKYMRAERLTNALYMLTGQRFAAGDAHAHGQGLLPSRQPLRQLAAIAGGKAQNADLLFGNQLADFFGAPLPLRTQDHPRAAQQWHPQTLGGGIEIDRIEVQLAIVRAHAKTLDYRPAVHGDFPVGHHNTLRLARGA